MTLLSEAEREKVSAAIAAVERRTDAELVTVLAHRSAHYVHFPLLWAALVALSSPAIIAFLPHWLEGSHIYLLQWLIFGVLAIVLQIPALSRLLVPRGVLRAEAANMARRQFLENGLSRTRGRTGVLIFVSEFERYVEILADEGISAHVPHERWADIVTAFIQKVRAKRTLEGFVACIEACGELLTQHVPVTDQKNELPDHLRIVE